MIKEATQFVTFYSYKGGVGRTSALVNAAALRALEGNNVVVIDFDLEAPGTAQYVKRFQPDYNDRRPGLLEYLSDLIDGATCPTLLDKATDLSVSVGSKNGGHLWLLGAGDTSDFGYTSRLEKLKWSEIFEKQYGEMMLRNLKNQIVDEFGGPDFVFIDSRTGITESGGVCTRYLADKLVILTSLNEQNINGTAMIYKELQADRKECILVATNVPVGMPNGKNQLFSVRIDAFKSAFGRVPDLMVYYYPLLSLSEEVPAVNLTRQADPANPTVALFDTDPLLESYNKLSRVIGVPEAGTFDYLLREVAYEIASVPKSTAPPAEIIELEEHYGTRYLAKIAVKAFNLHRHFLENADNPHAWNGAEYLKLIEADKVITNRTVKDILRRSKANVSRLLRNYLVDHAMERSFEKYVEPRFLWGIQLNEIARKTYDWPIDYLRRQVEQVNDNARRAPILYNLSHCLFNTGQTEEAKSTLKRFVHEFSQITIDRYPPTDLANFYFCAALAYKFLDKTTEANMMRENCAKQLSKIGDNENVFSPIVYKSLPAKEVEKQLSAAFKTNVALLPKRKRK